jgi:hypothetical protein
VCGYVRFGDKSEFFSDLRNVRVIRPSLFVLRRTKKPKNPLEMIRSQPDFHNEGNPCQF